MTGPIYNLHNHTPFSDGALTIDELCEAHLDLDGIDVAGIGICDHLFATPTSREVSNERDYARIFGAEARQYLDEIFAARRRWEGKLRIFAGCEINWPLNKQMMPRLRELFNELKLDYVLFEFVDWAGLTQLANQARRWPCPVGLAHTDVQEAFPNTSLDQVVRTMANARIFYEANWKFHPLDQHASWFNVLPDHRVRISVGTDTHDDERCLKDLPAMFEYLDQRKLGDKLLDPPIREMESIAQSA